MIIERNPVWEGEQTIRRFGGRIFDRTLKVVKCNYCGETWTFNEFEPESWYCKTHFLLRPKLSRISLAHHEAGHAAVGRLQYGLSIDEINIEANPHGQGYTAFSGLFYPKRFQEIDILLAGFTAEELLLGHDVIFSLDHFYRLDTSDAPRLREMRVSYDELVKCYRRVQGLVADLWPRIEAMAGALERRGRLDASEIAMIWGR